MRRVLAIAAIAATATAAGAVHAGDSDASGRRYCGKIASTSIYPYARVYVIRNLSCRTARKVARRYDRYGTTYRHWRCGLAHGDRPRLFSCGSGGRRGSLSHWPRALEALGSRTR